MAKGRHSYKNKLEEEKGFTNLQEDAIIYSMICLQEAFMLARKRKDVRSLIDLADKWYGISQAFEIVDSNKPMIGFGAGVKNE
jgi:hypothetical protein